MTTVVNITFFAVPHIASQVEAWLRQATGMASQWPGVDGARLLKVQTQGDTVNYALQIDTSVSPDDITEQRLPRLVNYASSRWGQQVTTLVTLMEQLS